MLFKLTAHVNVLITLFVRQTYTSKLHSFQEKKKSTTKTISCNTLHYSIIAL